MPGGDISELTLRRLKTLAGETRRDRLAVAALVGALFPSTQEAHAALEALLESPAPPRPSGRRTRAQAHLEELADDVAAWACEIAGPLAVLAAAEAVRDQLESGDKPGGGDSSPSADPGAEPCIDCDRPMRECSCEDVLRCSCGIPDAVCVCREDTPVQ